MSEIPYGSTAAYIEERLLRDELHLVGQVVSASNLTVLVDVGTKGGRLKGIYKPEAGERPLWDFPRGSLHLREVAAFLVSKFLGWGLVPITVTREEGPFGRGSIQMFIEHDPRQHYFTLRDEGTYDEQLAKIAVFDVVINNADRKGSHLLLNSGHIWCCDHGVAFSAEPKLRTVIWDYAGMSLPLATCDDLRRLAESAEDPTTPLGILLLELIDSDELAALAVRARALAAEGVLPDMDEEIRQYPWPLL